MRLLLDTHTFLWFIGGDGRLSDHARTLILDPTNERFLSIASLWEMAIKTSLGKLKLALPFTTSSSSRFGATRSTSSRCSQHTSMR